MRKTKESIPLNLNGTFPKQRPQYLIYQFTTSTTTSTRPPIKEDLERDIIHYAIKLAKLKWWQWDKKKYHIRKIKSLSEEYEYQITLDRYL